MSQNIDIFKNLPDDMFRSADQWKRWLDHNEPEKQPVPDYETRLNDDKDLGTFYRMVMVRSMRMDRALLMVKQFIRNSEDMGKRFTEPVSETIDMIYSDMTNDVPVIFLLSIGADPTDSIENLAKKKKNSAKCVSMGEGQEEVATQAMNAAAVNGTWVLLQNCELGLDLMVKMEEFLAKLKESMHPEFRLFITALPNSAFPLGLLQMCTKVTNEPPSGMRAGLIKSYTVMVDQERLERIDSVVWRQMVFGLCFLHSAVQERRKFGPLGWNIPYEYNNGDLSACLLFLEAHLYETGAISWPTLQYMVSEAQYGGKITDDMDRRLFQTYASSWVAKEVLAGDFTYNPAVPIGAVPENYQYKIMGFDESGMYHEAMKKMPEVDTPEIFGLHPNADLTFRVKEVNAYLGALGETQPKDSGGGGGERSREDVVFDKAGELLEKLPPDYIEDEYRIKIRKLGGLEVPLNIFLFQEIQRLQNVIARVRQQCTMIRQAIKGEVTMTTDIQASMNSIFEAKVPGQWLRTPGGDEFSWLILTLGLWFTSLQRRNDQMFTWLNEGRPNTYWMTGFFNPQGFLTAMKQEVTRLHKAEKWALDEVIYQSEITNFADHKAVRGQPAEGVYVNGLLLDGAAWSDSEGTIVESEPKILFVWIPILYVTARSKNKKVPDVDYQIFKCPCYKYPTRTDRFRIFMVDVVTRKKDPNHWIMRGVALLCSKD